MSAAKIRFVDELKRRNQQTRDAWELYARHRRRVTELACAAAEGQPRPRRFCALGAGNCNDLDLAALVQDFDEVHLVDLDAASLTEGIARQSANLADPKRIKPHGRMDVTGCLQPLAQELSSPNVRDERIDAWIAKIRALPPFPQPSPFHVVASLGLLTQLAEIALLILGGPDHPRGNDLLFALRNHHLRKLLEMTRPGGVALLVTDVVSSFTFPNLPILNEDELSNAMYQQVAMKNFFTGANPYALAALFRNDPDLRGRVTEVEMLEPWRWNQAGRALLVSGLRLKAPG
jgi:hypothetical protein